MSFHTTRLIGDRGITRYTMFNKGGIVSSPKHTRTDAAPKTDVPIKKLAAQVVCGKTRRKRNKMWRQDWFERSAQQERCGGK